jgi:hypothetical protein
VGTYTDGKAFARVRILGKFAFGLCCLRNCVKTPDLIGPRT